MNPTEQYIAERDQQVNSNLRNAFITGRVGDFTDLLVSTNYIKNFTWCGIPILQYPGDVMVMQELIYALRPDYIIETGIAFGGSLVFYASILNTLNYGMVIGIDIDIREHNRKQIIGHPLSHRIMTIQGDSTSEDTIWQLGYLTGPRWKKRKILVVLDSLHTEAHVLKELELYAPMVSVGSYIVVQDTAIEFYGHLDKNQNRPWGKGNNPWTAVQKFLKTDLGKNFVIDKEVETRALITGAIDGWLKRVK